MDGWSARAVPGTAGRVSSQFVSRESSSSYYLGPSPPSLLPAPLSLSLPLLTALFCRSMHLSLSRAARRGVFYQFFGDRTIRGGRRSSVNSVDESSAYADTRVATRDRTKNKIVRAIMHDDGSTPCQLLGRRCERVRYFPAGRWKHLVIGKIRRDRRDSDR